MPRFSRVALAAFLVVASGGLCPSFTPAQEKVLPPEKAKAALLRVLDRPKVPADVREDAKATEKNKLSYSEWSFASEKTEATTTASR